MPTRYARIPESLLAGADRRTRYWLDAAAREANLRVAADGRRRVLQDASQPGDLIEAVPLRGDGGRWVDGGVASLTDGEHLVPPELAEGLLGNVKALLGRSSLTEPATPMEEIRRSLLLSLDPSDGLAQIDRYFDPSIDLFVIRPSRALYARHFVWRILTKAAEEELALTEVRERGLASVPRDAALGEIVASLFVCPPLAARNQPLAAVFETARHAVIVAVPQSGAFVRYFDLAGWPSGNSGVPLRGEGQDIYSNRYGKVPDGLGLEVFQSVTAGADRLVRHLTDPGAWVTGNREVDVVERNIAWASVQFGLDALTTIASTWSTSDRIWSGFRALGVLEGLWGGSIGLRALLHPETLRTSAIERMPEGLNRDVESDLVDRYERELLNLGAGDLSAGVERLVQVRHLIHGVGVSRAAPRDTRLKAMRDGDGVHVPLVSDIARVWWTSVIQVGDVLPPSIA